MIHHGRQLELRQGLVQPSVLQLLGVEGVVVLEQLLAFFVFVTDEEIDGTDVKVAFKGQFDDDLPRFYVSKHFATTAIILVVGMRPRSTSLLPVSPRCQLCSRPGWRYGLANPGVETHPGRSKIELSYVYLRAAL